LALFVIDDSFQIKGVLVLNGEPVFGDDDSEIIGLSVLLVYVIE